MIVPIKVGECLSFESTQNGLDITHTLKISKEFYTSLLNRNYVLEKHTFLKIYPPLEVEVRRHKKRRINKKWNKKYGEKIIKTYSKDKYISTIIKQINVYEDHVIILSEYLKFEDSFRHTIESFSDIFKRLEYWFSNIFSNMLLR